MKISLSTIIRGQKIDKFPHILYSLNANYSLVNIKRNILLDLNRVNLNNFNCKKQTFLMSTSPVDTNKPIENEIKKKINSSFNPIVFKIENNSAAHAHHASMRARKEGHSNANTTESHFSLEIVSEIFSGKNMPARHRMVYSLLKDEMAPGLVHALQLHTYTPSEYENRKN